MFQESKSRRDKSRFSIQSQNYVAKESNTYNKMMKETLHYVLHSGYGIIYALVGGLEGEPIECWDQTFVKSCPSEALSRLTESHRHDFVPAGKMVPGVGLLGAIWNEVSWNDFFTTSSQVFGSGRDVFDARGTLKDPFSQSKKLFSRDVVALASDPDQAYDLHLHLLVEAGIGIAVAAPYNINGNRGIAIFGARPNTLMAKLRSQSNTALVTNAASMIGSLKAMRQSYAISRTERVEECASACQQIVAYFKHALVFKLSRNKEDVDKKRQQDSTESGISFSSISNKSSQIFSSLSKFHTHVFSPWLRKYCQKCFGAPTTPPPALSWRISIFCFISTFAAMLPWSILNEYIIKSTNGELSLTRGSYGSLVAAQYLLFASPAAQPWNAFVSEFICGAVALTINYIPGFPIWLRTAVTPSIIVLIIAKTGVVHPTAGADALLYAHDGASWAKYGLILFNYVFGIIIAIIINNLHSNRQYPNYWGWLYNKIKKFCIKEVKTEDSENEKDL